MPPERPDKAAPKPASKAASRKPCPICGRPSTAEHTPFCTDRCRQVDLGRWLSGSYVIPARDDQEDGDGD